MIDDKLLRAYIVELEALRDHGRDFAIAFPDIASRLDISAQRSRDPHVERVVESAAMLAARLRQMIEEDAAGLPLAALSVLAPTLVEPVPSITMAQLLGGSEVRTIPRGTRFDCSVASGTQVCFSTTMPITVAPLATVTRRLDPMAGYADGIAVRLNGRPPNNLLLSVGDSRQSGAMLIDAFDEHLAAIEVLTPDGERSSRPAAGLRIHGFSNEDAALPVRPGAHQAYRNLTEFLVFPDKYRLISVGNLPPEAGTEIRFLFNAPLPLAGAVPPNFFFVNRVPVVNLWRTGGTPIDINGRQLEYPVRVDALRYRTVECHSVETVDLYASDQSRPQRLDPVVAFGNLRGTMVRWGVRRKVSKRGGEVLLYFQGLDYRTLGRQRLLATTNVLASNRDLAQHVRAGTPMLPVEGMGSWRGSLVRAPTAFQPALVSSAAMAAMVGFLQSAIVSLPPEGRTAVIKEFLKRFPGGENAGWIDGLGTPTHRSVAVLRGGQPQSGIAISIPFDTYRHPTTSRAVVRRVLGQIFDSQRGLNRVEEVSVDVG